MKTIMCKGCLSDLPVKGDDVKCPCCGTVNEAEVEEERFAEELESIKNEEIRNKTIKVLEYVNVKFFQEPASSTGKYHPDYAQGNGGLYRHTCAAVKIANSLLSLDYYDKLFDDDLKDYIRSALILHDSCKSGTNFERAFTVHEHPFLAAKLVKEIIGSDEYSDNVSRLISSHMGQWNKSYRSRVELPIPKLDDEMFVHICDYLASRKFLEVKFNQ